MSISAKKEPPADVMTKSSKRNCNTPDIPKQTSEYRETFLLLIKTMTAPLKHTAASNSAQSA